MTYSFVKRRLLTEEEKYRRAIFYYTFDDYSFEHMYEDENNLNDEYGQPLLKIKENFERLDDKTKSLVLEFVKREVYDETVDLKCLNCFYEELNQDWESIEEMWNGINYPILYCPKCSKGKFVPLEIWKAKKMRR